ncbi:cytochrome b561/ferric reductase transmembrane [Holotrichia oblita]|uniref:Cytochrome b561/ferric reductase transmembrane n=1 Tax=Holotrichia oblita TaxID=644536 RepID=A0ACB9T0B9_HOLOL|nr:cytochrome b561/ferric reductase transmembrane [Holotrichia oblita]
MSRRVKINFQRQLLFREIRGFPDGAPVDACVKPRPNQPYHGQARSQPANTNPYYVIASSDRYGPGQQITVTIQGREHFKGFFIQARDAGTNEWIGEWVESPNTKIHPECSAITHADPKPKNEASLIWKAPRTGHGNVYFTGTVLKEYTEFWSDIVNTVGQ